MVSFGMTLEAELSDFDEDDTKARLARLYNVSVDAISLSVEAGSLKLRVAIVPADRSEGGVAALTGAIQSKETMAEMSTVLGSNATVTTAVNTEEAVEEYEATCPLGHWCSVGLEIPCGENTYNDELNQNNQGACKPCPTDSVSPEASVSIEACACKPGYYDEASGTQKIQCVPCVTGSWCSDDTKGITLASLPLLRGYYRTGNASNDLRRCPDFGDSSGCVGGVGFGEGPCKDFLRGPYCKLCNVTDGSRFYSPEKSACLPCKADAVVLPAVVCSSAIAVIALAMLCKCLRSRCFPKPKTKKTDERKAPLRRCLYRLARRLRRLLTQLSLKAKAKQLLGFFQVATRVADVYETPMPESVSQVLAFAEVLNVNIAGLGLPLQCLGIGTYQQQLATTMIAPLVLAGAIVLGFVLRSCCGSGPRDKFAGLLAGLPWLLTLSFLVFPMVSHTKLYPLFLHGAKGADAYPICNPLPQVSSAAFRAFSCERFDTGREFLRADLSVECSTATHVSEAHETAKRLALAAILIYPVGISALYIIAFAYARPAIRESRPTRLSQAISFLSKDFEPEYLWWEARRCTYQIISALCYQKD